MRLTNSIPAFMVLAILASSQVSAGHPSQQTQPKPYTIGVRVGLAVLPVTVTDRKQHRVSGLKMADFQVYEDGRPQELTVFEDKDAPVTVGLLVDNSASMGPKRPAVIAAAMAFAESSNPQDEIFVVKFDQSVHMEFSPAAPFTSNLKELRDALSTITARGETALYDAIAVALDHLKGSSSDRKYLIIMSDGGDNASRHSLSEILTMVNKSNVAIYSVGIVNENYSDENPGVLKKLSKVSGGEFYLPESVPQVVDACKLIARDIRQQYKLGYVPANPAEDGKYRRIKVTVSAPGIGHLRVRTRDGYLAPTAAPIRAAAQGMPAR